MSPGKSFHSEGIQDIGSKVQESLASRVEREILVNVMTGNITVVFWLLLLQ